MRRADVSRRWIVLVLALAAVLRFVPIWFGLPFEYARPDEEVTIGHAVDVLGGDFNPRFFHWPSLTFYLLAACFRTAIALRHLVGVAPPDYVGDLLIARGVVAAAGTLTVALVYLLTRRIGDGATGGVAALCLAVAPLHVRDSHFAMTDILATCLIVGSMLLLVRALESRAARGFAAAGFVGGLAASTKYSAGAIVVSMAAAQLWLARESPRSWRTWRTWLPSLAFAPACAAGFLLGTPYALLDRHTFFEGFTYDVTHLSEGHNSVQVGIGWTYHLTRSLPAALSWPLLLAGTAGFVLMAVRRRAAAAVLGAFCLAVYAALGSGHTVFFRYILPIVPFLCVAAAFAIRAATRSPIALLIVVPALVTSVWSDTLLARPDTRVLVSQWLAEHVKPSESLYQAGSSLSDAPLGALATQTWPRHAFDGESGRFIGSSDTLPDWLIVPESPLTLYSSVPASLRTVASQQYEIVHRVRATRPDVPDTGVYDLDDAFYLPVTGFHAILRPGPTFIIYRRLARR
ncbi:MAG TPA: glycosyltransferase family 39 protein [Vicinamibacterales bacterium]|nr:glycosyltransferase family 39 protein [Vicinamibacterales bacterium]